ncbi:MAG: hypothetical protein H7Y88_12730 [Phycisphaerales bacterium]|nr:hypothetical protein [Phycisphaerales bacterium]
MPRRPSLFVILPTFALVSLSALCAALAEPPTRSDSPRPGALGAAAGWLQTQIAFAIRNA